MHRMKIGLVAAIVLLALTGGIYSVVTRELKESTVRAVEADVSRAQRMHGDIARLEALEFANLVGGLARRPPVVAVFSKADDNGRRQAAFEQAKSDIDAARKATAQAMSSGSPNLPSGICPPTVLLTCSGRASVMSVAMNPGATALQVIERLASSRAMVFVNPSRPALEAA